MTDDELDQFITCQAVCIGLPIDPSHRPDIAINLRRLFAESGRVMQVLVPTDMEPAPVFRA